MREKLSLILSDEPAVDTQVPDKIKFHAPLPDTPLIKIRVGKRWSSVELRELWAHRELLYFLVWRDLKVRYKQTVLGATWIVLQPVLMTFVFAVFLGKIAHIQTGNTPHILFLYSGLLPWTFFSNAVASSSYSLIASAHMITKVYFPRSIVPAAAILVRLSDFIVASLILVALLLYYQQPITWSLLLVPLLVLHLTVFALSIGLLFAALNVKYRDLGTVLPVLIQLWMFASPILYSSDLVPANWRWAYYLNPLSGIIGGFRASLLGLDINRRSLLVSAVVTIILLVYGSFVFKGMEDELVEIV
jgi:lipopolysaccharide transport system permease protein